MVQATPSLCARLRLTTKQVGRGFYKGNRVGSMGSHTRYGGYVIDWRKVRSYNVPDLTGFKLTPYVSREINPKDFDPEEEDHEPGLAIDSAVEGDLPTPVAEIVESKDDTNTLQRKLMKHLMAWRKANPGEFEQFTRHQYNMRLEEESRSTSAVKEAERNYAESQSLPAEEIRSQQ